MKQAGLHTPFMKIACIALLTMLVFNTACQQAKTVDSTDHAAEVEEWHQGRIERLQSEEGWLSLVALHWLEEGDNTFGSGPQHALVLSSGPETAGNLILKDGEVTLADPHTALMIDGEPAESGVLKTDNHEDGYNKLTVENLRFYIVQRGDRFAVRVKDPDSPIRQEFTGIDRFPVSVDWRIKADWMPHETPVEIPVATIIGTVEMMQSPGTARFEIDGTTHTLDPVQSGDSLWYIFRDETSGKETYGAGRYLYGPMPEDGKVTIDFNKAYNPPCAFTSFATCPLPPKQNRLEVRVEAGEKIWGTLH